MRYRRLAYLLALGLAFGCTGADGPGRVIVLGIDGLDPNTIDLLMSEGKLPNFARLRQDGAYGRLESQKPLLSPIIWTTIATGKSPLEHGIGHFVTTNEKTGEELPATSQMRRVKALWNIASATDRSVAVVGWWATWPAETVRGAIVSDHTCYHFLFPDGATGAGEAVGVFYPPTLATTIAPLIRRPGDLVPADVARFVTVSPEEFARVFDFQDDLGHFKWALATAETYTEVGLTLWRDQRPDLLMVYVEGVDSTSHLFGHLFRAGNLSGELAAQQTRYGGAVEAMYGYADEIVGRYLDALDERTTLVVLSDHGFQLGILHEDPSKTRDMRRVSERYHRLHGILYLYGRGVARHGQIDAPKLLDIAPTLLALLGVPPAKDMPGRVLGEVLTGSLGAPPERTVASYETPGGETAGGAAASASTVDPTILEHLRALGYLDTASPRGDRNIAALHFEAGRYEDAVAAYRKVVEEKPSDAAARASLAGALGALGRLDESLAQLDMALEIDPLNAEAYHNRGVIHERRNDVDAAIAEYRAALRYNPQYDPSRQALVRLTGSGSSDAVHGPTDERAAALAERAREAAQRGDYTGALAALDEAQRLAPRLARIYQYRANVAFLRADLPGAIAAMETALEIEPDNALFRTNLERLRAQAHGGQAASASAGARPPAGDAPVPDAPDGAPRAPAPSPPGAPR